MMYMTTIVSLTLLVMAYHVEAYSAGAPESVCQTMVPGHQATSLSSDPFYVNVSSDYYCPGEDIHIDIGISAEGNAAFQGFKGFLCKANLSGIPTESMHEAGTLTATVPYHNVCSEFPSVTHASNTLKTDLHLIWRNSSRVTSTQMQVKINCTIVIDFSTYKLGITTPWITQGLQQECNGTSAAAPSCAAGSYYNLTQQACVLCPAGYFCPPNTWTYEDYACLAGYYCPTGSSLPTQVPCPPGTYRADTLGTSITDCHLCPCGKYCDMNALTSPTGDCNEGYYCIEGAESATPTDGISGNSCSSGYICPAGSCKQTACIEGYNCTYADHCHCFQPSPPQNGNVQIISVMGVQAVFTCDVGYEFAFPDIPDERSYGIYCSCGEWRGFTNVTCAPVDCGGNATLNNGYIYYGDGTTFGAASVFVCNTGYRLNGLSSAVCMASGQWSRPIPECELVDCGPPRDPVNGFISDPPANSTVATTFNSVITYECNDGFLLEGHKSRRCLSSGVWSGHIPLCVQVLGTKPEPCINDIDDRGTAWEITPPGMVSTKPCLDGFQGVISRNCTALGQWLLPTYNCVRETLDEITKLVEGAAENPSESLVSTILTNLSDVTTSGADDILYEGELQLVTTTLENIVDISQNITIDDSQKQNFIRTASNLVDKKNADSWKSINQANEINNITENGPAGVLRAVDGYSEVIANSTTSAIEIKEQNIVFRVANYANNGMENIRFPVPALAEEMRTSSFYFLSNISLEGVKQYSSVFYKNLTEILPTSTSRSYSSSEINGAVLTLKLIPYKSHLESPLELHFQHFNTFYKNPVCSYWNFDSNGWDNEGCTVTSTNSEETSCKCNHLTNFAILMSPYKQDVSKALNIVSIVGCSISLIGLVLTIVVHVAFWRYVKSERVILILCLSAALIIFYIIFIAGVERTENEDACSAVAVLLHYCLLVVFFMMLAAAVQIAFSVLYVFGTKVKKIKLLLPIALGVPAIIVTISASVTKLNGYGTEDYCWLATDNGVIWAFIGPAIFVICVNMILLILILKTMHSTKFVSQKSGTDKLKSTVKCLCVLLPVMGVTWVLGLFYINDDTNWIQYLFAVCNSLQGLVIFVFHCALNKQIHKAFLLTKRKYSVETSESRLANQMKKIKMKDTL